MSNRLFVYGSLLSAFSNQESIRLKGENIYLGPAYIKGFLFEIDGYPGAIPDPVAGYKITGELYRISDLEKTFNWLDRYEEADLQYNPNPEYQRILVSVYYRERIIRGWMYQFLNSTQGFREIPSGNHLDYLAGS
jgi:gamma-glutamylcyclotransferase (GGCT)/AIG2-like uncharacterized protein YtfP